MKKTVAEILLATAQAAGAKHVFGLVGESLNGLTDALREHPGLTFVEVRHQEAGAFAAGGEANISGELGVCVGSCGPGSVQLLNGLYDCHRSHLPVLAIVAQVPTVEIGVGGFQEIHPQLLFRECSHYCEQISVPEQAMRVAEAAVQAALGLEGVSVLIVPADVLEQEVDVAEPVVPARGHRSAIVPASDKIDEAAALLNSCERVTILAGSGVEGAHAELLLTAQVLQAPVVHSLSGMECIQPNNPFDVGQSGEPALLAAQRALRDADGVLLLGVDFPFSLLSPLQVPVVQVDRRAEYIGRHQQVAAGLHGSPAETLQKLLPHLRARTNPAHLHASQQQHQADLQQLAAEATSQPDDQGLRPQLVARLLNELAPDDAIFTCDVGTLLVWAGRYLHMNGRRRLINSFVHGSAGAALPQALGAAASAPGRPVVALCGDGGLAMLLGELLTLRQLQLPIKIVVFNNGGYRSAELLMEETGKPAFGTQLNSPDFARLADAIGIRGLRVSNPAEAEAVLHEAFAHDGPVLVDALVQHVSAEPLPHTSATATQVAQRPGSKCQSGWPVSV